MLHPKLRSRNITCREGRRRSESWQSRESGRPYRTSPTGLVLVFLQKQGWVNIKKKGGKNMQTKDSFYNIAKELEVAQENKGYLIVIRCGAFFTSIGANAIALSNELGLKLTCWKKGLCKAGVPINALYNYVKRLDSLGYNYVIYNYSKDEIINNGKKYAECYRFEGKPIDKSNLLLDCKDCEYYEKSYSNIDIFTDMKRIQEFKELKEKQEKIEKMGKIISLFDEDK